MRRFIRVFPILVLFLFPMLAAHGQEATQRKAFIEFLQTRVLDKQSEPLPQLDDSQKKAFGPYTRDYAVISDFLDSTNAEIPRLQSVISSLHAIQSPRDLISRHDDLVKISNDLNQFSDLLMPSFFATSLFAKTMPCRFSGAPQIATARPRNVGSISVSTPTKKLLMSKWINVSILNDTTKIHLSKPLQTRRNSVYFPHLSGRGKLSWLERRIVVPEAVGSIPIFYPKIKRRA